MQLSVFKSINEEEFSRILKECYGVHKKIIVVEGGASLG